MSDLPSGVFTMVAVPAWPELFWELSVATATLGWESFMRYIAPTRTAAARTKIKRFFFIGSLYLVSG